MVLCKVAEAGGLEFFRSSGKRIVVACALSLRTIFPGILGCHPLIIAVSLFAHDDMQGQGVEELPKMRHQARG